MFGDIKAGLVLADLMLVHSFSHFFLGSFGSAFYRHELEKFGMRVVSATQELGDDANGNLMTNVLSAFDEYSSLETAKHVTRSMRAEVIGTVRSGGTSTPMRKLDDLVTEALCEKALEPSRLIALKKPWFGWAPVAEVKHQPSRKPFGSI